MPRKSCLKTGLAGRSKLGHDIPLQLRLAKSKSAKYVLIMTWAEMCEDKLLVTLPNKEAELEERKRLYFEKGASEFWLWDLRGEMSFFDQAARLDQSRLCPDFPKHVVID